MLAHISHFHNYMAVECSEVFQQHEAKPQQLIFIFEYLYFERELELYCHLKTSEHVDSRYA